MKHARQRSIQGPSRMHGAMTVQPIVLVPTAPADLPITDADPYSDEGARLVAVGPAAAHPNAPSGAA